jgi:hypothetical protein
MAGKSLALSKIAKVLVASGGTSPNKKPLDAEPLQQRVDERHHYLVDAFTPMLQHHPLSRSVGEQCGIAAPDATPDSARSPPPRILDLALSRPAAAAVIAVDGFANLDLKPTDASTAGPACPLGHEPGSAHAAASACARSRSFSDRRGSL